MLSYDYNDEGIRTSKTVNGVEHTYSLSGSQIVAEEWGSNLCVYLYDADGAPIGMQYRTTGMAKGDFYTFWFEKNLQGDIVAVYNESGTKVYTYQYDAWGNCTATPVSSIGANIYAQYNPFRYRGYYYDSELGMYYLQSRYYDPAIGRFINSDGQLNGGLLGYNQFAYCANNPVMNVDPDGEFFVSMTLICVAAFATIGAIAGGVAGYKYAEEKGVDKSDTWKYVAGGSIGGGIIGGIAGYFIAPAITAITGVAGISVTAEGVTIVGTGSVLAEQAVEGVYYQVTSSQAAQQIAQTEQLIPSQVEKSVCVLNFQPTLDQARQLGAYSCDTVIRFRTNCSTFIPDTTVGFEGAFRNMIDGAVKIFDIVEVGFK